jgi:hypothetical protein
MIKIRRCLVAALAVSAAALTAISPAHAAKKKPPVTAAPPQPASAATRSLGRFASWTAYVSEDKTGKVCYLVGQPRKSEPAGLARNAPMAMVTHRPAEKIANVVSFVEGYPLKEDSEAALDISGSKFGLFTKDDSAWARTAELDKSIVATLAKGKEAVVRGVPQKGPATTDWYALIGFPKALALIDKACGIKREDSAAPPPPPKGHAGRS